MSRKYLVDIWLKEFISRDENGLPHCGLCGNSGRINVDNMTISNNRPLTPLKAFCICPNGRTMKKKGCVL